MQLNPPSTGLASAIIFFSASIWGLYWMPLRYLETLGVDGAWSVVLVNIPAALVLGGVTLWQWQSYLIGNGGAELGVRGYLSAYDANTGELTWRFYTAPNPNKEPDGAVSDAIFASLANDTWGDEGKWTEDGGGGTVWDSIIYDEVNDLVIFGVGNGSPWNHAYRDPSGGDNLFLSSMVAVKPETGEYVWHFQTTPGDNWDYTATQHIMLADLPLGPDGASRRVAMQAPKNGFFYVVDAATGAFISGDAFVPMNWASGLDETGRPIELPEARSSDPTFIQVPGALGAHNWHPMAFSPDEGLVYIPAQQIPQVYVQDPNFLNRASNWNTGIDFTADSPADVPVALLKAVRASMTGQLVAWDPVARAPRWAVDHDNAWNGGILSTAGGLVFQGKLDGTFAAYNAANGERVWQADLKSGGASGPGTFELDGEQYVTITTGWGSAYALSAGAIGLDEIQAPAVGKVVTFKLGGTAEIADYDGLVIERVAQAEPYGDEVLLTTGREQYARHCRVCHGAFAMSSGVIPDLRWSAYSGNADSWAAVVKDGALSANGMVSFANVMPDEDIEAIRAYVVRRAHDSLAAEVDSGGAP